MSEDRHMLSVAWIWLSLACGAGSDAFNTVLPAYDYDASAVYRSGTDELRKNGVTGALLTRLSDKNTGDAEAAWRKCEEEDIRIITPLHRAYPKRLYAIRSKPIVLYCRGTLPALDKYVCIASVGTRDMSEYGRDNAYMLSFDMARAGAVIVSGMARGIDGMCHRGALDAGGFTVAVLGCGIDKVYPPEHTGLYGEIARSGLIITEFAPGTPPEGRNFPVRNRIISGLSNGTLVVECSMHSGALLTANSASMQGRDLFALPGKVGEKNSEGVNRLISEGAKIVTCAKDILSEYEPLYSETLNLSRIPGPGIRQLSRRAKPGMAAEAVKRSNQPDMYAVSPPEKTYQPKKHSAIPVEDDTIEESRRSIGSFDISSLNDIERKIYELMPDDTPVTVDMLAKSGLPTSEIIISLTMLEIKRGIRFAGAGAYIKIKAQ